jgi:enterobactin synthetase component D / holo-[acyl-carrier protein] synthase
MLEAIVPDGVYVAESFGDGGDDAVLLPAEAAAVAAAGPQRRREFAAVRACARRALASAGFEPGPVPRGPAGAPVWPPGVVGSMTHCNGYRACAIGRTDAFAAIGIDAEPHEPLPDGVLAMAASERERAALAKLAADDPGVCWAKVLFSAKEAIFKARSPATGRWLGFADANVEINADGTFAARLAGPRTSAGGARTSAGGAVTVYHGRWLVGHGLIATAVVVPVSRP